MQDFGFRTIFEVDEKGRLLGAYSEDDYFENYQNAMQVKQAGDLQKASEMLELSCVSPTIYKGHYRELFVIYREFNKQDFNEKNYQSTINRVLKMLRYNDEMLNAICKHWSVIHQKEYQILDFVQDSNIKLADLRMLLKCYQALNDLDNQQAVQQIINEFKRSGGLVTAMSALLVV